ncbi:MAG: hypothetical protein JJ866_00130 [Roseibium sp.]|uniref:hypothetical protein n=1 Tax=Roseibium sp. TaxID=1936156 RepID=UPI001B0673C3|nr:hypothetical protein [Roseibium sp.]MBO6890318.1 hypothetical protein [Roseibium sp.]MBO6932656.1 hypothetical protein [Roseibium sp.]
MTFRLVVLAGSILFATGLNSTTALASSNNTYCGADVSTWTSSVAPELDGFWEVKNGVGTLSMMGRTMALPAGDYSDGAIETATDGTMTIMSSELQGTYPVEFVQEGKWNFDLKEDTPLDSRDVLTTLDLGVLLGCDPNTLPRLHASGTFAEEGGTVAFDLYLFVVSNDLMYGATKGKIVSPQGNGTATRLVTFSR